MDEIGRIIELQSSINAAVAEQARLFARYSARPVPDWRNREFQIVEVARALSVSDNTAGGWIHNAQMLTRLPRVFELARVGELSRTHCDAVVNELRSVQNRIPADQLPALLERIEDAVLPKLAGKTPAEIRRLVRKIVARLAPSTVEDDEQDAFDNRGMNAWIEDGQSVTRFRHTPDQAAIVHAAVDAFADKRGPGDGRSMDQRRADAMVDICQHALHCKHFGAMGSGGEASGNSAAAGQPAGPNGGGSAGGEVVVSDALINQAGPVTRWQGRKPNVNVTVSLSTLLALSKEPGDLTGFGPISAGLAREIGLDPTASWNILITTDLGKLLYQSEKSYRPSAKLRVFVLSRDGLCSMPGCMRPARRCELDHVRDWGRDGETAPENLQPLCPRHHHAKHDGRWKVQRLPDGDTEWKSPSGRTYRKPAPELPIDTTGAVLLDAARTQLVDDPPPF